MGRGARCGRLRPFPGRGRAQPRGGLRVPRQGARSRRQPGSNGALRELHGPRSAPRGAPRAPGARRMKSWLATVARISTAALLAALLAFTIGRRSPTASSEPVVHSAIDAEAAEVDATVSWSATKEAVAASPTAGPEVVPMGPAEDGARPEASRPSLPLRVGPTL